MNGFEHTVVERNSTDLVEAGVQERIKLLDHSVSESEGTPSEFVSNARVNLVIVPAVFSNPVFEVFAQ